MNQKTEDAPSLVEEMEQFVDTNTELYTLRLTAKIALILSGLFSRIVILTLVFITLFMMGMGLALWIGESLGHLHAGFFIIGGVFTILVLILFFNRYRLLRKPVLDSVVSEILKEKKDA